MERHLPLNFPSTFPSSFYFYFFPSTLFLAVFFPRMFGPFLGFVFPWCCVVCLVISPLLGVSLEFFAQTCLLFHSHEIRDYNTRWNRRVIVSFCFNCFFLHFLHFLHFHHFLSFIFCHSFHSFSASEWQHQLELQHPLDVLLLSRCQAMADASLWTWHDLAMAQHRSTSTRNAHRMPHNLVQNLSIFCIPSSFWCFKFTCSKNLHRKSSWVCYFEIFEIFRTGRSDMPTFEMTANDQIYCLIDVNQKIMIKKWNDKPCPKHDHCGLIFLAVSHVSRLLQVKLLNLLNIQDLFKVDLKKIS